MGIAGVALGGVALSCLMATAAQAQGGRLGRLVIDGDHPGAQVFVDSEPAGVMPLEPLRLAPGRYAVRVALPGFTEFNDVVRVRRGQTTRVEVELLAVSAIWHVETDPEAARIFVDGNFSGQSPTDIEMLEGEHSLRVQLAGYRDVVRKVAAVPGQRQALSLSLDPVPVEERPVLIVEEPPRWYERPALWAAVGGGAVAIAAGIFLAVALTGDEGNPADGFCSGGCVRLMPTP